MADDGHRRSGRLGRELLEMTDPGGHRLENLAIELWATRDELAKISGIEPAHARSLGGAEARDGRRAEKQRQLAEVAPGLVHGEQPIGAVECLTHFDASLEETEERRLFALVNEPVSGTQPDIRAARSERLELGGGQRGEQWNRTKEICGNHASVKK